MEYEKHKKIRAKLLIYTNQQIKISKNNNKKFLINSTSLDELEKKNLQSKEFFVVEKPQNFKNIDNNRSIVENIYINNKSFRSNIIIYPLSSRLISNKIITTIDKIFDSKYNNAYKADRSKEINEKVLKEISSKTNCEKQNNRGSPTEQPILIKKEVGERKLKKSKKSKLEINFHNTSFSKDNENEKVKNDKTKNEYCRTKGFSRQLSSETIATEISRIIRVCHNAKSINSSLSRNNRIFGKNDDINMAKKYAKKLKYYCRMFKLRFPNKENINKLKRFGNKANEINTNRINSIKAKYYNNKDKNIKNENNANNLEDKANYSKKSRKCVLNKVDKNFIKKMTERIRYIK